MATLDLSKATQRVDMTDPNLVTFGTAQTTMPTAWSYRTSTNNALNFEGAGFTYDTNGRALSGTVSRIAIDIGNNNAANPDVMITNINAAAATLDDGPASFWSFLEGNDTIIGPNMNGVTSHNIFGDGFAARTSSSVGGNDMILAGATQLEIAGDVWTVGSQTAGAPESNYQGGDDEIIGSVSDFRQGVSGDAYIVNASGTLTGGDDTIFLSSGASQGPHATGDAYMVEGVASDNLAVVHGGDDIITGGSGSETYLIGDVHTQRAYSFVRGGEDTLIGGEMGETIMGDVKNVGDNQLIGGDDTLWGNGGGDDLFGDFSGIGGAGKVTGGNDTIYGGRGQDKIFGEGQLGANTTGGDDRLFGEAGDDAIYGGTGNDLLDGGTGNDTMIGGTGNDIYVIDLGADPITELANEGVDTVRSLRDAVTLLDNVENLTFITTGYRVSGTGNDLDNTMTAGALADYLSGKGGNDRLFGGAADDILYGEADGDVLNGGAGNDKLYGGEGYDTASYAGSSQAVRISLDGTVTAAGDAIGDTLDSIEAIEGTGFDDILAGDVNVNELFGGGGNDTLNGGAGADYLSGQAGDDTFWALSPTVLNDDSIDGGSGTDTIQFVSTAGQTLTLSSKVLGVEIAKVNPGTTALNLDASAVTTGMQLFGNDGANVITGTAFDDTLTGNGGADTLNGGLGNDTYALGADTDAITDTAGVDTIASTIARSLANYATIENLTLLAGANATGNSFANMLTGNAAANILDGGTGIDRMIGGGGNDTYVVDIAGDVTTEAANAGTDTVRSSVSRTLGANLENLTLTGATVVNGTGNSLANTIIGNAARNNLKGGSDNDTLMGNAGNDTLIGGTGRDLLTGGSGRDRFDFDRVSEAGKTAGTRDIIKDFRHAQDKIDLSTIDANRSAAGNGKFVFTATEGAGFTRDKGQLTWDQRNFSNNALDKTIVSADINGDGRADFTIELTGLKVLSATDFLL